MPKHRWYLFQPWRNNLWRGDTTKGWRVSPNVEDKYHFGMTQGMIFKCDFNQTAFLPQPRLSIRNLCSNWDVIPLGIIPGDLGPKSKYYCSQVAFSHRHQAIQHSGALSITATRNYSQPVSPPLNLLWWLQSRIQWSFSSKAVLEFPLGQVWDVKENKKASRDSQETPGWVQRRFPRLCSHALSWCTTKGRTFMVFIPQVS